jgi:hypothetical protein
MALKICLCSGFVGAALLCASGALSWAQPDGSQQPPLQRDDSATSGAGPTSGAPGQFNYSPPGNGPVTTDAAGATTTYPNTVVPKTNDAPLDRGNESVGAAKQ